MKSSCDAAGKIIPFTANQVLAKESKIFDILQLEKSPFTSGGSQLLSTAALAQTGSFDSIEQQAALQLGFSQ